MFGYIKPLKAEMLVKEYEFYSAVYCGICRAMKKHTGVVSNVTLNYDSVFLALVRMLYIDDSEIGAESRRCIAHPTKKKPMLRENEALEYTARAFAILTYYKMADDLHDEKFSRKAVVSALRPILSSAKKRAGKSELADTVRDKLDEINKMELDGCPSVDRPADAFGQLLGAVFSDGLVGNDKLVPYEVGYHLGRFIYSADAAEDYDKDRTSGSYNPYVILYDGADLTEENKRNIKCALLLECKKIEAAVNLLPFGNRATIENIINNIIYLGLPSRIKFLDTDEERDKEK